MRGWVRCAPAFSERRERLAENHVCSRLHSPQRLRAVAAVSANHVFAAQKWFDYPSRTKQKQTIKKMELIKTIRTRVGTLRLAELRPLMRFPQFVACSRLHGRKKFLFPPFRRTMFLLRKNGSIIHPPKQKQTIKKMELIKTIRARVGTVRSRIFRTPRAFSGKSRVLPTTQSAAAARRCGRFGEPCFCCAKMVRLSITHQTKTDHQKDGVD